MNSCNLKLRTGFSALAIFALSACPPKEHGGESSSETSGSSEPGTEGTPTTGSEDVSWAYGRYYQPVSGCIETSVKPTIEIRDDHSATLELEFLGDEDKFSQEVKWQSVGADMIEFSPPDPETQFTWFDNKPFGVVRMHRTDTSDVIIVSDGGNESGSTLGKFKRGEGCLVPGPNACVMGSYVTPCK